MRTIFFIPPLSKMSGGLAAIFELADILHRQGRELALSGPDVPGGAAYETPFPNIARLPWSELSQGRGFAKGDLFCVPESWPNALLPGLQAGVRSLVYAQSWVYFLSNRPGELPWRQLPLEYLAVSGPVAWFMRETLGLEVRGILPAAVAPVFFGQADIRADVRAKAPVDGKIRVAWMPRKNRALGRQILQIASNRLDLAAGAPGLDIVEIDKMSWEEVADALGGADIFLASGFPEGFGLPPLEAMAAGCVPVGFAGLGGFEYMRNPGNLHQLGLHNPLCDLPQKPWGANGLYVSDGDVIGAGLALALAAQMAAAPGKYPLWGELRRSARLTAAAYSLDEREKQAARLWDELEADQAK